MSLNNNLFGLSQVSSNNPLLNRQQMNIGAGLNANGTLKAPTGSLAGNSPVKASGGFGWAGAVIDGVNNIASTIAQGKQNKQIEQNKKKLDLQQRQLQAQQYNQQINNNFIQANTLPLQQRNKNGF